MISAGDECIANYYQQISGLRLTKSFGCPVGLGHALDCVLMGCDE